MKRLLSLIFVLLMMGGALVWPVDAASAAVLDGTRWTGDISGQGWHWAHGAKVLTLTDGVFIGDNNGIVLPEGASLVLQGYNRIQAKGVGLTLSGSAPVTVSGDGVLEISQGTKGILGTSLILQGEAQRAPAIYAHAGVELSGDLWIHHGGIAVKGGIRVKGAYLAQGLAVKANGKTKVSTSMDQNMKVSYRSAAMGALYSLTVNGPQGATLSGAGTYVAGERVNLQAKPEKLFQSWSFSKGQAADPKKTSTTFVMPASDTIATAVGQNAVKLNFSARAGGTIVNKNATYGEGQKIQVTAKPDAGYVFSGWSATAGSFDDPRSATTQYTVPSQEATVTALFAPLTAGLTVSATPGGSVNPVSGEYAANTQVFLQATPMEGYEFVGWSASAGVLADPKNPKTIFTVPDGPAAVVAQFAPKEYVLTVRATNQAGGKVLTAGGRYHVGDTVTLQAKLTNTKDYIFGGWSASAGSFSSLDALTTVFTMPAADVTVEAVIASKINELVVTATEGGIVKAGDKIADLSDPFREKRLMGTKASFTAEAKEGYYFTGWTVSAGELDKPSSMTVNLTMPAKSVVLTANFMRSSYELRMVSTVGGWVNAVGGRQSVGTAVELIATPREGYRFAGWTVKTADPALAEGILASAESQQTVLTMPACTCEVTANFAPIGGGPVLPTIPESDSDLPLPSGGEDPEEESQTPTHRGLPGWAVVLGALSLSALGVLAVILWERRNKRPRRNVYRDLFYQYHVKTLEQNRSQRESQKDKEEQD